MVGGIFVLDVVATHNKKQFYPESVTAQYI